MVARSCPTCLVAQDRARSASVPWIRDEDSFDRRGKELDFSFFLEEEEIGGTNWKKGEFRLGGKRIENHAFDLHVQRDYAWEDTMNERFVGFISVRVIFHILRVAFWKIDMLDVYFYVSSKYLRYIFLAISF